MMDKNHMISLQEVYSQALDLHTQGKVADAAALYGRILEELPDADLVLYNLGLAQYQLEEYPEAVLSFRRSVELNPENHDGWFNLGLACKRCLLYPDAEAAYRKAIELQPDDPDSWYNLGRACQDQGQDDAAIRHYELTLEQDGEYASAMNNLAYLYHRQGRYQAAEQLYLRLLKLRPGHPAARHMLASLQGVEAAAPPAAYVKELFDHYSESFDRHLVEDLKYRVPSLLWQLFRQHSDVQEYACGLDLGCGTGLAGEVFRPVCRRLIGLDLSPKMIARAEEKQLYDALLVEDAVEFLTRSKQTYSLVLAADVLIYFGALEAIFMAVARCTEVGGLFCFTIELGEEADWSLRPTGRYAHTPAYIERAAAEAGWQVAGFQVDQLRLEQGKWIEGVVYLLRRT